MSKAVTATVRLTGTTAGNYTLANTNNTASTTANIAKATPIVAITWEDSTYNGNANTASASVSGVLTPPEDLGAATLAYYSGNTASGTPLSGAPVNAGTYTVRASFAGNTNYEAAFLDKTITIARATGSVSINNLPSSATVGGSLTPTYAQLGDGTPSTTSNSTSICTVSGNTVTFIAAGTYKLQASVTQGTNHNAATGTEQTFTMAAATPAYNWTGFFSPIDNGGVYNVVKAGQSIPIKFSLSGFQGYNIFTAGSPTSARVPCSANSPLDNIEEVATPGSGGLSYDATTDRYNYVWKTDKAYAGTCRQLTVKLADGTTHTALFNFTR